jgi:hypothetical protein
MFASPIPNTDQGAQLAVFRQILTLEELLAQFRAMPSMISVSYADLTRRAGLIADLAELAEYDVADADPERV